MVGFEPRTCCVNKIMSFSEKPEETWNPQLGKIILLANLFTEKQIFSEISARILKMQGLTGFFEILKGWAHCVEANLVLRVVATQWLILSLPAPRTHSEFSTHTHTHFHLLCKMSIAYYAYWTSRSMTERKSIASFWAGDSSSSPTTTNSSSGGRSTFESSSSSSSCPSPPSAILESQASAVLESPASAVLDFRILSSLHRWLSDQTSPPIPAINPTAPEIHSPTLAAPVPGSPRLEMKVHEPWIRQIFIGSRNSIHFKKFINRNNAAVTNDWASLSLSHTHTCFLLSSSPNTHFNSLVHVFFKHFWIFGSLYRPSSIFNNIISLFSLLRDSVCSQIGERILTWHTHTHKKNPFRSKKIVWYESIVRLSCNLKKKKL